MYILKISGSYTDSYVKNNSCEVWPVGLGDGEEEESEAAELHALQRARSHGDPQARMAHA